MGKESKISKPINIGFAQCLIVMIVEFAWKFWEREKLVGVISQVLGIILKEPYFHIFL